MIAEPPSPAGGVKLTVACPFAATAETPVGGSGVPVGVTLLEGADAVLLPITLVAITVQVTAVPPGTLVTTIGDAGPLALRPAQVAV